MSQTEQMIVTVLSTAIVTLLGASGFWAYLMRRMEQKDSKNEGLRALLYYRLDKIMTKIINRTGADGNNYVTIDEWNTIEQLYKPYKALNGDGKIEHMYNQILTMPMRKDTSGDDNNEQEKRS